MQLLIQNKGVAPAEAFTLLGASLSRENDNLIGQFGTGTKHAITALLRKDLKVVIYVGKTRMEFKTKDIVVKDDMEEKQQRLVWVQYGGTSRKKQDLGWVLGFGAIDWKDTAMAIREFVANAIDHTVKTGDTVRDATVRGDLLVTLVKDDAVRAKEGYTRIYIEADDDCETYVNELPRRFLHFTGVDLSKKIMPKLGDRKKAQIYYNGVWVCELSNSADSLCDYNFTGSEIQIDEARNLNEYSVRAAIGRLYRDCGVEDLVRLFTALSQGEACLETGLDAYYIKPDTYCAPLTDAKRDTWREAWRRVNGEAIACAPDDTLGSAAATRKGNAIRVVNESNILDVIKAYGVKTVNEVITEDERKGRSITSPTEAAVTALDIVWGWIVDTKMVDPFETHPPKVFGFDEVENKRKSFQRDGGVYVRNDLTDHGLLVEMVKRVAEHCDEYNADNFVAKLLVRRETLDGIR